MNGWIKGRIDGWMHRRTDGWMGGWMVWWMDRSTGMDRRLEGWTNVRDRSMDRRIDGWTEGWMSRWTDGRMSGQIVDLMAAWIGVSSDRQIAGSTAR